MPKDAKAGADMSGEGREERETREWLEGLRGLDLSDAEVESAARRLLADRETALPILLEQFNDPEEDATLLAVASVALKGWERPYPIEALMALLRSREVGALAKALIMNVLERYGIDLDGAGLLGVGIDLEECEIEAHPGSQEASRN